MPTRSVRSNSGRAPDSRRPKRHEPFVEAIDRVSPGSQRWCRYRAGLSVLTFIDWQWSSKGKRRAAQYRVAALRRALDEVRPRSTGALLNVIVRLVEAGPRPQRAVLLLLVRYANRLAYEGEYPLANHVYHTVIAAALHGNLTNLLPVVHLYHGSSLREQGDMEAAMESYETGLRAAARCRNERVRLRIAIAKANLYRVLGRLVQARASLIAVLPQCRALEDPILLARASHELGIVSHEMGQHVQALGLFVEPFGLFKDDRDRYRLLNDIGRGLRASGWPKDALATWTTVFTDAKERYTRWAAAINIMALAIDRKDEWVFDQYRKVLERAPMPARLLTDYLIEVGDGCRTFFGRDDESRAAYTRAARVADRRGFTIAARRAFDALAGRVAPNVPALSPAELPPTVARLVELIRSLRSQPNLGWKSASKSKPPLRNPLARDRLPRGRIT
jgi:tetratricopeptide (TPR) repeat protein